MVLLTFQVCQDFCVNGLVLFLGMGCDLEAAVFIA